MDNQMDLSQLEVASFQIRGTYFVEHITGLDSTGTSVLSKLTRRPKPVVKERNYNTGHIKRSFPTFVVLLPTDITSWHKMLLFAQLLCCTLNFVNQDRGPSRRS